MKKVILHFSLLAPLTKPRVKPSEVAYSRRHQKVERV